MLSLAEIIFFDGFFLYVFDLAFWLQNTVHMVFIKMPAAFLSFIT